MPIGYLLGIVFDCNDIAIRFWFRAAFACVTLVTRVLQSANSLLRGSRRLEPLLTLLTAS